VGSALAAAIEKALPPLGTKARAEGSKAYLKSDLAFLGLTTPVLRRTVLALAKGADRSAIVSAAKALWERPVFELRAAAVELLVKNVRLLTPDDVPQIERFLREAKTWALVDGLAPLVMGPLFEMHPKLGRVLDRWAKDRDFWVRRASLLTLLVPLRNGAGDFDRFARYADTMLEEKEFFIRKAIGWVLREVSKKRPALVVDWLEPRKARASGVTMREAVKYLTAAQRKRVQR